MDDLFLLRKMLCSPNILAKLIAKNSCEITFNIDNFLFNKIPVVSSEPDPREVYCIQSPSTKKYFLKLNQHAWKIENEYRAYKLIRFYAVREFSSPEILDLQINVPYGETEGQQCSWLIEEWLDYKKEVDNSQDLLLSARILAQINSMMIDLEQISRLFSTPTPSKDKLAENARLDIISELRRDLPVLDKNITLQISKAAVYFENKRFPYMLSFNHGDYHKRNIIMQAKKKTSPIVLDWEDFRIDNPIYDLSHFLYFLQPCDWSSAIRGYFSNLGNIFVQFSSLEIVEMIVSMYSVWAARNLRWSARRIDDPAQLQLCQNKIASQYCAIRSLSWKNLVK